MYENVRFLNGGKFTSRGQWKHPRRKINSTELILVLKGEFDFALGDAEFHLTAGDVLRIDPDVCHGGTTPSEDVSFYWLHFTGAASEELPPVYCRPESLLQAEQLVRQILHYSNTDDYPRECKDSLMKVLLAELRYATADTEKASKRLYTQVKEWVRINCDLPMKVSDIAEKFNYSADYLNRVFKKYEPAGLKAYIDRTKLQRIKHDLVNEPLTLKELADRYGFDDYKYFLKYFRYHEGISPKQYRQMYYNIHTNNQ